jgi:hypothetical protein
VTSDFSTAGPFTPGASIDTPPLGDVERQAVASLRGYAYQVAAAALAWIDLDRSGKVYLEVAEDYAEVAQQSLDAVQVKDTAASGPVTLNSEAVREAIAAFVGLVASNRDRNVQLRFFTTSLIGTERKASDRPGGEAGLRYWRRAAAGADVGPLRAILTSDKFPAEVQDFVNARNDEAVCRDLLQKIHWDCGQSELAGITKEIEERLIVLGRDRFNLPAAEAKRLSNVLMYQTLKTSILRSAADRVLTRADLYSAIDIATQMTVPRRTVGPILELGSTIATALAGGPSLLAAFSAVDTSWLIPRSDLATPHAIIPREAIASKIEYALLKYGRVILVGGSGLGKSIVAREFAGKRPLGFVTVDLRIDDATEVTRRLGLTLGHIGALNVDCLIFDDLNQLEDGPARTAFVRCVQALQRRDRSAIVTAYRRPSQRALTELGLDLEAVIEIPYLTEDEAIDIVRAAAGDPEQWGRIAFAAGAQGHPQLVHAFVLGMAARGWPLSEARDIVIRGFASDDIDAERDAVRRSMGAALSEPARDLLYRLSLVIGWFDRALALKVAEVSPPIQRAGELLDNLVGPWVEAVSRDAFRVSPLAAKSGQGMLTNEAQQAIHAAIAIQMLAKRRISAADTDRILTHGLLGKETASVFFLACAVLTAESKALELLREHSFLLPMLTMDRPIFATHKTVSTMLRLAQFRLLAHKQDVEETTACVKALLHEAGDEPDTEEAPETTIVLSTILNTIGIASSVPNWVQLLQRLRRNVEANPQLQELKNAREKALEKMEGTFYGTIFRIGIANVQSVERLEGILTDLDHLTHAERSVWLENFEGQPAECSLLVNSPWTAEQVRNELNPVDAEQRYKRMALLSQKWNFGALAIHCHEARAVMLDEYMNDETGALTALDEAIAAVGEDVAISRARARIFWRHGRYHDAVTIMRDIADVVGHDSPIERAYAMRQAAISAAKTDDWLQAEAWFAQAEQAAASSATNDMHTMAVGLEADRSVALLQSSNVEAALQTMSSCLTRLAEINPDDSLRAAYCHRVVRHTVLWIRSKIDAKLLIDSKPIEMLPGTCSNPEPPAHITDLPLGHLDFAWYMLAGAEISSGRDIGIVKSLRSRLQDGPVLLMEFDLRDRRIKKDVVTSDSAAFARHLLDYVAAMECLRGRDQADRDTFSVLAPARGEIQPLSPGDLAQPVIEAVATDAIIAFGMAAALRGTSDPTIELQKNLTETIGEDYPGKVIVDKWRGIHVLLAQSDEVTSEAIALIRAGVHLEPRRSWEVGLRLSEYARRSQFRKALAPLVANWLGEQWKKIIANETFRLSRPLQTVPLIEASLAESKKSEAFVASVLLASAEAVGSPLGAAYEKLLKEISVGER